MPYDDVDKRNDNEVELSIIKKTEKQLKEEIALATNDESKAGFYNELGIYYRSQGKIFYKQAEESYLQAIQLDNKKADCYFNLARLYFIYHLTDFENKFSYMKKVFLNLEQASSVVSSEESDILKLHTEKLISCFTPKLKITINKKGSLISPEKGSIQKEDKDYILKVIGYADDVNDSLFMLAMCIDPNRILGRIFWTKSDSWFGQFSKDCRLSAGSLKDCCKKIDVLVSNVNIKDLMLQGKKSIVDIYLTISMQEKKPKLSSGFFEKLKKIVSDEEIKTYISKWVEEKNNILNSETIPSPSEIQSAIDRNQFFKFCIMAESVKNNTL